MGKVINIKLGLEDDLIKQDVSLSIHLTRAHRNSTPILLAKTWLASKRSPSLLAFHCPNDEVHSSHYKLQALPDLVPPFLLLSAFLETILSFPSRLCSYPFILRLPA